MPNNIKVSAQGWIEAARHALLKNGIAGVKIDRLAQSIGVTRGGFYHHFKNHRQLLDRLLESWVTENHFMDDVEAVADPSSAIAYLDRMIANHILEQDYSPSFDQAIREWARIDERASTVVDRVDAERMRRLATVFRALGCDEEEAIFRARVLYFHQVGFFTLGYQHRLSKAERLAQSPIYMRILCGRRFLEAAGEPARKWL